MEKYLEQLYNLALESSKNGDIPVGCLIIKDGNILSTGHNTRKCDNLVIGHAEINAICEAEKILGRKKILCSPEDSHFPSENKGGKSSARQRTRIFLRKTRRKILCSPMGSHFPSENKEDWDEEVRDYYQT